MSPEYISLTIYVAGVVVCAFYDGWCDDDFGVDRFGPVIAMTWPIFVAMSVPFFLGKLARKHLGARP